MSGFPTPSDYGVGHIAKQTGFAAGEFTFAQPNGVSVRAPLEFWVAAILSTLPEHQIAQICARVELISKNALTVQSTDGLPLRVSSL